MFANEKIDYYFKLFRVGLKKLKAESVLLDYEGSGDSGMLTVSDVHLEDGTDTYIQGTGQRAMDGDALPDIQLDGLLFTSSYDPERGWVEEAKQGKLHFSEIVTQLGYSMLARYAGGWEINEGSRGVIVLNAEGIRMEHEHFEMVSHHDTFTMEPELSGMEELAISVQE
jgi:hypothetical protein